MTTPSTAAFLAASLCIITACSASTVGGTKSYYQGKETTAEDTCMASCLERTSNGQGCVKFSLGMADVCSRYLHGRLLAKPMRGHVKETVVHGLQASDGQGVQIQGNNNTVILPKH